MYYLINDKHVVRHVGLDEWMKPPPDWHGWTRVDETHLGDGAVVVSTVFLGLDHSLTRSDAMIFETMTFSENPDVNELMERCSTWDEAVAMHKRMVDYIQRGYK